MVSRDFVEPLFNHLGFISPPASIDKTLETASLLFEKSESSFAVITPELPEYSNLGKALVKRGFKQLDQMSVMKLTKPVFKSNVELNVKVAQPSDIKEWCETYLNSFYGNQEFLSQVLKAVKKSLSQFGVKLLIAYLGSEPAGVSALCQSDGLTGVYCVGTLPKHRRKGVASTVLKSAYDITREAGSSLILQTFVSDSVEPFYFNLGFDRVYKKNVFIETNVSQKVDISP
jgi:GNAT superfamily N-acetyltransferase